MRKNEALLSRDMLLSQLHFASATGQFFYIVNSKGERCTPVLAGKLGAGGYLNIKLYGISYSAHRLAWFLSSGRWPKNEIGHRDGDRTNNHPGNLFETTNFALRGITSPSSLRKKTKK